MIPRTFLHLYSGGLDSTAMLYLHQEHFQHCLLVDYHQPHRRELDFARYHCRMLNIPFTEIAIPELSGLNEASRWIVPARNSILLSLAVNLAAQMHIPTVTIGCNADDTLFPDCAPEFIAAYNSTLTAAQLEIEICAPFINWPKWKIAELARELGITLATVYTCYRGTPKPCGTCPACLKLSEALC